MKHRLLNEFTREEIKLAFDQADVQKITVIYVRMNSIYLVISECVKNEPTDSIDL
jgi:hypothetical protein